MSLAISLATPIIAPLIVLAASALTTAIIDVQAQGVFNNEAAAVMLSVTYKPFN